MDSPSSLLSVHRDIRSSSVPHLRNASQRAKYGGSPPTDAFLSPSDFPHTVELGKPKTNLTSSQKFTVAHGSVGSLIGKRVNRNNQRTGERDPWRYYGAGRRWAKKLKSGKDVDVGAGMGIWRDEDIEKLEVNQLVERWHSQLALKRKEILASQSGERAHEHSLETMAARNGNHEEEAYIIRVAKRKRDRQYSKADSTEWDFVRRPSDSRESCIDDGWDIVSIRSAPD